MPWYNLSVNPTLPMNRAMHTQLPTHTHTPTYLKRHHIFRADQLQILHVMLLIQGTQPIVVVLQPQHFEQANGGIVPGLPYLGVHAFKVIIAKLLMLRAWQDA
jgi:hypothetical protein